ncbi:MAG: CarD family transcriptional regulator, partial [Anaerolineales bacterium]
MESLIKTIQDLSPYKALLESLKSDSPQPGLGLSRAARLPFLSALHADLDQVVLLVTDRADHALSLFDELEFWVGDTPRFHFAEPNPLFYEQAAWGIATRRERLQTLTGLARYHLPFAEKSEKPPIIVTSARSLMTRSLPRRDFLKACKRLSVGQTIQPELLLRSWVEFGYQRVDTVLEPGQFSHRGGLLDVWPPSEPYPARLDFFGDEIDTIRRFDPASQRTVEKLEALLITPAREFLNPDSSDLSDQLDQSDQLSEFHIPLLHKTPATLLDYLPQKALVLIDDVSMVASVANEVEEQALNFRQESVIEGTLDDDFPIPYLTWSELDDIIHSRTWLELGHSTVIETPSHSGRGDRGEGEFNNLASCFSHDERFGGRLKPFVDYLGTLIDADERAIIISRQSPRLQELWRESREQVSESNPTFIEASLSEGFVLTNDESLLVTHLITDSEVFGWERPQPRLRQRQVAEAPESLYADLLEGDYVVHVDHGIGRFSGLVQRQLEG